MKYHFWESNNSSESSASSSWWFRVEERMEKVVWMFLIVVVLFQMCLSGWKHQNELWQRGGFEFLKRIYTENRILGNKAPSRFRQRFQMCYQVWYFTFFPRKLYIFLVNLAQDKCEILSFGRFAGFLFTLSHVGINILFIPFIYLFPLFIPTQLKLFGSQTSGNPFSSINCKGFWEWKKRGIHRNQTGFGFRHRSLLV